MGAKGPERHLRKESGAANPAETAGEINEIKDNFMNP
jgi:hypothetical protein